MTLGHPFSDVVRDIRRAARRQPGNAELQIQADHLEDLVPETTQWAYENKGSGLVGWIGAFLLVGAIFCCGLREARSGYDPDAHPAQQIAITQPAPEREPLTWPEAITAIGILLAGVGSCGWFVRKRSGFGG